MAFRRGRAHRWCSRIGVCTVISGVVRGRRTTAVDVLLESYISLVIMNDSTEVWIPIGRTGEILLHLLRLAIELTPCSKRQKLLVTICRDGSRGGVGGAGGARFADGVIIIVIGITGHKHLRRRGIKTLRS